MRNIKNYPTGIPHVKAHISVRKDEKTGMTILTGYPINEDTGIRCDNCKKKNTPVQSSNCR